MSMYITLSQTVVGNDSVRTELKDITYPHNFYIGNESLSLELSEFESANYYVILSLVLTLGEKFWYNFCESGGSMKLKYEFSDFIQKNLKMINRDINLEKIIEE